jgi:hypothetical protein
VSTQLQLNNNNNNTIIMIITTTTTTKRLVVSFKAVPFGVRSPGPETLPLLEASLELPESSSL